MKKYKITIVDYNLDDAVTLKNIICKNCTNLVDVNYFTSLEEAITSIEENNPDIVILDILLRKNILFNFYKLFQLNGIEILFVSHKEDYLHTSEKKSFEYIFKPFHLEDVILAINNILNPYLKNSIDPIRNLDFVTIASLDKIDLVAMKDIIFCGAEGKYTTFHLTNGRKIISSKNLGEYEKVLNQLFFYRVHHGYIINIKHLVSVIKTEGFFCKLINDISVPIAKRKQSDFNRFIRVN